MVLRIAPTPPPTPPRLCPDWPPNHQRAYFSPVARVSHDWAPTYPTALRTTPRTSPGFSRLWHGAATNHAESAWFRLIRGSAPKTLDFLKFSGRAPDQPRITKNHPDSPRTCYGSPRTTQTLLRLTPTHPDSRFVAHSAPDSGMCNWGFSTIKISWGHHLHWLVTCRGHSNRGTLSPSTTELLMYCSRHR